ncbi:hypothetical protein C8A03DRAFT_40626 [Achaetomium macrosporum]|uniref:HMG box domain-containing protein n=1 Tax=Achaetomium macrosporum TaxID=79813 RepID=A0AAN7CH93_9PEZI|nr:hypothetical protein C8A03DRAFT_40626 [Achaetomium macrosporum]
MATLVSSPMTPMMASVMAQKYWNHLAIQLGHWNKLKVIIMDDDMYQLMPIQAKIELAREMGNFLDEDVMYAQDADNDKVWILGPKKVIRPHLIVIDKIPIWDPKKRLAPESKKHKFDKIPRPPNAYILYRKDKHSEVKAQNPSLHNNEISVITGAMWKDESPEVREKYHKKATDIKTHLLAMHPGYRYNPRKPHEIPRRARRNTTVTQHTVIINGQPVVTHLTHSPFQHNAHRRPEVNNRNAGIVPTSDITRHVPGAQQFLPPVETPGWTPYHLMPSPVTQVNQAATFEQTLVDLVDNWDVQAELAQMYAELDDEE